MKNNANATEQKEYVDEVNTEVKHDHDYANSEVPADKRKSMWELAIVTLGMVYGPISMITAKVWADGFGFWQGRLINLLGLCIVFVIIGMSAGIGAIEGLPGVVLIRKVMGKNGAKIFGFCIGLGFLGWFGVQTGFFTAGLLGIFPQLNYALVAFIGGILMMTTAIVGFKAIAVLSKVAIPMVWIWLLFGLYKVYGMTNGNVLSALNAEPLGAPMTVMQGIILTVGQSAVGASVAADIYRYMRPGRTNAITVRNVVISNAVAFLMAIPILAVFTMIITSAGSSDFGTIMTFAGGPIGVLMLVLLAWTTNDNNLYSSALSWKTFFPERVQKYQITIVIGIIGSALAAMNILGQYMMFLNILCSIAPPAIGILGVDYFVLPRFGIPAFHFERTGKNTNYIALFSWLVGSLIMLANLFIATIPFAPIISLLASSILYVVGTRIAVEPSMAKEVK